MPKVVSQRELRERRKAKGLATLEYDELDEEVEEQGGDTNFGSSKGKARADSPPQAIARGAKSKSTGDVEIVKFPTQSIFRLSGDLNARCWFESAANILPRGDLTFEAVAEMLDKVYNEETISSDGKLQRMKDVRQVQVLRVTLQVVELMAPRLGYNVHHEDLSRAMEESYPGSSKFLSKLKRIQTMHNNRKEVPTKSFGIILNTQNPSLVLEESDRSGAAEPHYTSKAGHWMSIRIYFDENHVHYDVIDSALCRLPGSPSRGALKKTTYDWTDKSWPNKICEKIKDAAQAVYTGRELEIAKRIGIIPKGNTWLYGKDGFMFYFEPENSSPSDLPGVSGGGGGKDDGIKAPGLAAIRRSEARLKRERSTPDEDKVTTLIGIISEVGKRLAGGESIPTDEFQQYLEAKDEFEAITEKQYGQQQSVSPASYRSAPTNKLAMDDKTLDLLLKRGGFQESFAHLI